MKASDLLALDNTVTWAYDQAIKGRLDGPEAVSFIATVFNTYLRVQYPSTYKKHGPIASLVPISRGATATDTP